MFTLTEMDKKGGQSRGLDHNKWLHLENMPQESRKSDSNNNDDSLTSSGNGMHIDDGATSQKRLRDDTAGGVGRSETSNARDHPLSGSTTKRLRQTVIARRSSRLAARLDDGSTSPGNHDATNSLLSIERDENGDVEKVYKCKVRLITCMYCYRYYCMMRLVSVVSQGCGALCLCRCEREWPQRTLDRCLIRDVCILSFEHCT